MKQKTRILIYILIAAAVVIMGVIAVFSKAGGGASAAGHIDLGRTYLIELSYDKAVIEFTEAIRIDPNNADAYLGLAEAYEKLGDTEKAIEWLEKGFELTGDVRIGEMLDRLLSIRDNSSVAAELETTAEIIGENHEIIVPSFSNMNEESVRKIADELGMLIDVSYDISIDVSDGIVISQDTPEGTVIKKEIRSG